MSSSKNIIWLASYPKSGNTWLRIFLENFRSASDQPASINDLSLSNIASSRMLFDRFSGVSSSDLTEDEIDRFRPHVYRLLSKETSDDILLKVHDGWRLNSFQDELFPKEITKAVVYIIRNPLDVLVSNAYHNSTDYHSSARKMNDNHKLCNKNDCLYNQLKQELFSWSDHVISWVDQSKLPVITIRYEDLIYNPVPTFSNVIRFFNWNFNKKKVQQAIEHSEISKLQRQEQEVGFREKPLSAGSFFRAGKTGSWKDKIENELVHQVYKNHQKVMDRFGYSVNNPNSY